MTAALPVKVAIPSLALSEQELVGVLSSSVYPGAKADSIKLVISYCRARHFDPLLKPVHIVPMDVKTERKNPDGSDIYEKRDVIMPGIGLYRTDAARTGAYAGKSEPEYGQTKTFKLNDLAVDYPEWCKVTVRRMLDGQVVEFTAKELWLENYATAGKNTTAPNKMWKKRPFAQLAKCAEAQALRMAFPEATGAQPTAEEMEGKVIDASEIDPETGTIKRTPIALPQSKSAPAAPAAEASAAARGSQTTGTESGDDKPLTEGERNHIKSKLESAALTEIDLKTKFSVGLDGLKQSQFKAVKAWIANPAGQ